MGWRLEMKVAFQGEAGAYSEEAAFHFFDPSIQTKPCESLDDVFKAVERREVEFGVVPIENSRDGIVGETLDLLATGRVNDFEVPFQFG